MPKQNKKKTKCGKMRAAKSPAAKATITTSFFDASEPPGECLLARACL